MSYTKKMEALRDFFNNHIKAKFSEVIATNPATIPATTGVEYTLADGVTKVTIDKLEVGGKITPAPTAAGSITLQDGTTIAHDAAGIITAVTAKVVETVEQPTEMKTAEQMRAYLAQFAEDGTPTNTSGLGAPDINKLTVIVKALFEDRFGWELRRNQEEAARAQAIEIYKTGFSTQEQFNTQVMDLLEMIADKAPEATEPAEKPWEQMNALERYRATKNK